MNESIIFIGPYPPPLDGNSLPLFNLHRDISLNYKTDFVNLSKSEGLEKKSMFFRFLFFLKKFIYLNNNQKKYSILYFSIAESFLGNLRDIVIYFLCRKRLNSSIVHMLGGNNMKNILRPRISLQYYINKYFLKQVGAIIVEGEIQKKFFANVTDSSKIHIIPNFAEDTLFLSESIIFSKFKSFNKINILFLSNLLYGKGHIELINAFECLDSKLQNKIILNFAGEAVYKKEEFLETVKKYDNIIYHGFANMEVKQKLFADAHIFCLPTYYPYEGQPFTIIEAFASACCVLTTNHSGISYIFQDKINGIEVEKKSVESLLNALQFLIINTDMIEKFGISNYKEAVKKYTYDIYLKKVEKILTLV